MPKKTEAALTRDHDRRAEIHADRLSLTQELGWLFRPLAVCPFPAASLGKRQVTGRDGRKTEEYYVLWTRRSGNVKVEILGHPDYGIPFGQDTLVVLYLAFEAKRQGTRKIKVNFYRDFMRMFEMNPNDGRKYRLVIDSLRRIRNAKYSWEIVGESRETGLHFLYIDEYDLYCDPKHPDQRTLYDQYIMLSERFWEEIRTHRIPSNLKAIIALKAKPAHLNFYIWLSYRVGQAFQETVAKGFDPKTIYIPFWGEKGLQSQLSSMIEKRNEYRRRVRWWLDTVKEIWPLCPVEIEEDALTISVTSEEQLDVMPKETDAPRIKPRPASLKAKPEEQPAAATSFCPACSQERTLKPGKQSRKGYRMPDYWQCAGGCQAVPADALCPDCGRTMEEKNRGRVDYYYQCECGLVKAGEDYWLQRGLASQPEPPEE